jgi:hypothetical protein
MSVPPPSVTVSLEVPRVTRKEEHPISNGKDLAELARVSLVLRDTVGAPQGRYQDRRRELAIGIDRHSASIGESRR